MGLRAGHRDHAGSQPVLGRGGQFRRIWRRRASTACRWACSRSTIEALRFLGRLHDATEGLEALETAQKRLRARVSFDLIYALPGQTPEQWASRACTRARLRHRAPVALPADDRAGHALCHRCAARRIHPAGRRRCGRPVRHHPRNDRSGRPARLRDQQPRARRARKAATTSPIGATRIMPASAPARMAGAAAWRRCGTRSRRTGCDAVVRNGHGMKEERALAASRAGIRGIADGLRLAEGVDLERLGSRFGIDPEALINRKKLLHYASLGLTWSDGPRIGVSPDGMPLLDALLPNWSPTNWWRHERVRRFSSVARSPGHRPTAPLPHTVRAYVATAERLLLALGLSDWPGCRRCSTPRPARPPCRAPRRGDRQCLRRARTFGAQSLHRFAREQVGAEPGYRAAPARAAHQEGPAPPGHARRCDQPCRPRWKPSRARTGSARATAAVLLLMYGAGLRIAEALSLTAGDLPLGETLVVTGKGGKQRVVPMLPVVRDAVADYARACPHGRSKADEPLFQGRTGRPACPGHGAEGDGARRATRWACPPPPRRMPCATASPRICWALARTCAACRNCSAMPASARRRSTPRSMRPGCWTHIASPIRARLD